MIDAALDIDSGDRMFSMDCNTGTEVSCSLYTKVESLLYGSRLSLFILTRER